MHTIYCCSSVCKNPLTNCLFIDYKWDKDCDCPRSDDSLIHQVGFSTVLFVYFKHCVLADAVAHRVKLPLAVLARQGSSGFSLHFSPCNPAPCAGPLESIRRWPTCLGSLPSMWEILRESLTPGFRLAQWQPLWPFGKRPRSCNISVSPSFSLSHSLQLCLSNKHF